MPAEVHINVGVTYVAGTLPPGATTLNVTPGSGLVLPVLLPGQFFMLVLTSPSTGNIEVVKCTGRSADTLTIERAQEPVWGRPAEALQFEDGDEVRQAPTAAWYNRVAFESELNALAADLATEALSRSSEDTAIRGDIANLQTQVDDRATVAQYTDNRARIAQLGQDLDNAIDTEKAARDAADTSALALIVQLENINAEYKLETLRVAVNANTQARQAFAGEFPAGTRMLFQQTTPPTGWSKVTTFADHALRLTSGAADHRTRTNYNASGINASHVVRTSFSDVFADDRFSFQTVLTEVDIPDHEHPAGGLTVSGGEHFHLEGGVHSARAGDMTGQNRRTVVADNTMDGTREVRAATGDSTTQMVQFNTGTDEYLQGGTVRTAGHQHTMGGSTDAQTRTVAQGIGGPGHVHDFTMDVNYASVILAQKDAPAAVSVSGLIDANFVVS